MGLDIGFHRRRRTLTSSSWWLNAKLARAEQWVTGGVHVLAADLPVRSDQDYKKLELVVSSAKSIEDAVENALARAAKTIRNMRWFEVVETRGHIEENKVNH